MARLTVKFIKVEQSCGDTIAIGILTTRTRSFRSWWNHWIKCESNLPYEIREDRVVLDTSIAGASDWMDAAGLLPIWLRLWLRDALVEHQMRQKYFS